MECIRKQSFMYFWQVPRYHYNCLGFMYARNPQFYVMDDFGNAVSSIIEIELDDCDDLEQTNDSY